MAQWDGINRAATIAQLVGVDSLGLISTIVQAAQAVQRNNETCQELVQDVRLIGDLLRMLQDPVMMQRVEIGNALTGLEGTLEEAHSLVSSCRDSSAAYRIFMGWKQTDQFRRVKKKIAKYLRFYPMISHADITLRLEILGKSVQSTFSSQDAEGVLTSSTSHSNPEARTEGSLEPVELERFQAENEPIAVEENQQADQHSAGNSQTEIDIEAHVNELMRDLRAVDSSSDTGRGHGHPDCLISRVNMPTRLVDPSEYDPYSVHIGPYHHDPSHWEEPAKRAVLRGLLPEMEEERAAELRRCLTEIARLEDDARGRYANSTEGMAREEFAQMLLLDGCYILHFFGVGVGDHSGASAEGSPTSSGIPDGGGTAPSQSRRALDYIKIVRDVVYLLENQIPFLVLEKIDELFHVKSGRGTAVVDAAMDCIRWLLREQGYSTLDVPASPRPCHLVHLLHMHFRPTATASSPTINVNATGDRDLLQRRPGGPAVHRWRLATQYDIAGVKFERRVLDGELARSVLDVELKGRTLRVPYLTVDSNTWTMLRNLMALEQHSPQLGSDVTAYCLFMSQVAGTEKDVALLAKKGIIVHLLGSNKDVAEGFENLCRGIAIDLKDPRHNYLSETMERLERRYHSRRNNRMAWRGCGGGTSQTRGW